MEELLGKTGPFIRRGEGMRTHARTGPRCRGSSSPEKQTTEGKNTLSYSAGAGTLLTLAFRAAEFPLISPLRQFQSKQQWSRMCSLV